MDSNRPVDYLSSLEQRLQAIATRDISNEAMDRLDDVIDGFSEQAAAGSTGIIDQHPATQGANRSWLWAGAAAIVVIGGGWLLGFMGVNDSPSDSVENTITLNDDVVAFTLLKSVNRVDAYEHDGLIIPRDGGAPHYRHRYHIVDEEKIRDERTGTIVTVRQPRQEVVTMPVTQF
ncbi:MAG: hypothetical protein AB8F34_16740 [Akkermansiaceae bacterium]